MNKMGRWEAPYDLLLKSYSDGCKYYGDLKKEGKLVDMTMSEFADHDTDRSGYTDTDTPRSLYHKSYAKHVLWMCTEV